MSHSHENFNKATLAGMLITIGIIFGDIGTSPLYVMKAIVGEKNPITELVVLGGISCVFWTLTLQTTFKYVILTLQADNNGEGGIFSLYTLIRKQAKWIVFPAILGGAALLADGIITPPISVSSAIEGLRVIYPTIAEDTIIFIVIAIISIIFAFQRFGTAVVGKAFGPVMLVWFLMLAGLGIGGIVLNPHVLVALSPHYAYNLLVEHPEGFWLLGAVFLCTTGAEALYSDMGHCGRGNIRMAWIFVKIALVLNYLGQGGWLINHIGKTLEKQNPFYTIMPEWFLIIGIIIATFAAIIASQALITGSFTLVSEAIRLNLWPKVLLNYPSDMKGQLYVPSVNFILWIGCIGIVLYFRESSAMEAAYGLAITLAMLMTTVLLAYYLKMKKGNTIFIALFLIIYIVIEVSFMVANLTKFMHGGFVTLIVASVVIGVMLTMFYSSKIKNRLTEYTNLSDYKDALMSLSKDTEIPRYATNLVYLTGSTNLGTIDSKIIYSIFQKQPKRADIYWFVHVDIDDAPYTMEYSINVIAEEDIVWVAFKLGFRVEQRLDLYFKKVVEDMVSKKEINITNRYNSLKNLDISADFRFVVLKRYLSNENALPFGEQLIMDGYFLLKNYWSTSDQRWFGLDPGSVTVEEIPMLIRVLSDVELKRV